MSTEAAIAKAEEGSHEEPLEVGGRAIALKLRDQISVLLENQEHEYQLEIEERRCMRNDDGMNNYGFWIKD